MRVSHGTCMEVRGQLCAVSSVLPLWLRSSNSSRYAHDNKNLHPLSQLSGSFCHIFDSLYNLEDLENTSKIISNFFFIPYQNLLLGTWDSPKVCRRHLIKGPMLWLFWSVSQTRDAGYRHCSLGPSRTWFNYLNHYFPSPVHRGIFYGLVFHGHPIPLGQQKTEVSLRVSS